MMTLDKLKLMTEKNGKLFFGVTLFAITMLRVFQVFWGYAEMDTGLYGSGSLHMSDYPSSMIYWSRYYLSFLISGSLTDGSLLSLRLLQVFSDLLLFGFIWYFLKNYIHRVALMIGSILYTFLTATQFQEYSYNNLSIFLLVVAAIVLYMGLEKRNYLYVAISAISISISVLTRFPNILAFSLICFIPYYFYTKGDKLISSQLVRYLFAFIVGSVIGVAIDVILLYFSGQLATVWQTIADMFGMVTNNDTAYSSGSLLQALQIQYGVAWRVLLKLLLFFFVSNLLFSFVKNRYVRLVGLAVVLMYAVYNLFTSSLLPFLSYALALYLFFSAVAYNKLSVAHKNLTFLSLFLLLIYPMGSACPIGFAGSFSFIFVFPILISLFLKTDSEKPFVSNFTEKTRQQYKIFILIALVMVFGLNFIKFAAFEQDRKTHAITQRATINSPMARGIFTSREKAQEVNGIIDTFGLYIKEKPCVINFHPTLLYLMEAKPYGAYIPDWLDDKSVINQYLQLAYDEQQVLPLLLFNKATLSDFDNVVYDFVSSKDSIVVLKETESHILYAPFTKSLN